MSATKNIHQTRKLMNQPLKKNENNFLFLSNDILISKDMHFNDFIFFGFYVDSVVQWQCIEQFNFHKHVKRRIRVIASNIASRLFSKRVELPDISKYFSKRAEFPDISKRIFRYFQSVNIFHSFFRACKISRY